MEDLNKTGAISHQDKARADFHLYKWSQGYFVAVLSLN
jgi:hypothetical protein